MVAIAIPVSLQFDFAQCIMTMSTMNVDGRDSSAIKVFGEPASLPERKRLGPKIQVPLR